VAVGRGSARSRLTHARLAHVTGLHFGAEDPEVVAGLRTDLIAQDVDRVLASGDLTMRARAGQLRAARKLLDSIGRPWTSVPGNHDVPLDPVLSRAVRPLAAYCRFVDAQPQPVLRTGGLQMLGLSTPRRSLWKGGQIDAEQVAPIGAGFAPAFRRISRAVPCRGRRTRRTPAAR
jgi:3',5'-cyclic AMP phosphodiesterase CpdA